MSPIRRLAVATTLAVAALLGLGGTAHAAPPAPGTVAPCPPGVPAVVCDLMTADPGNENSHWG